MSKHKIRKVSHQVPPERLIPVERIPSDDLRLSSEVENLSTVLAKAAQVFGGIQQASRWLETPIASLGYKKPSALMLNQKGVMCVMDVLCGLERGTW